jgi:hypothetical protein
VYNQNVFSRSAHCRDIEDAENWIKNTITLYKDHRPIMLIVFNEADQMDEASSFRSGGWRRLSLKVKHPGPGIVRTFTRRSN